MTQERYEQCMRDGLPYFGVYMLALQGSVARHAYMRQLVAIESQRLKGRFCILEIGSWAGGSAVTWAKAIQEFCGGDGAVACVDPWKPYPIEQHHAGKVMLSAMRDDKIFHLFVHNIRTSGVADIVTHLRAESKDALKVEMLGQFDIIFVDGSHTYEDVRRDIQLSIPLLKDGGVLCGDDLELQAHEVDKAHMKAYSFRDYIKDPEKEVSYHPGVTRAVGECIGPVPCWCGFWAVRWLNKRWTQVELFELEHAKLKVPDHIRVEGELAGQKVVVQESGGPQKTL